jgi:hypothetical protein
VTTSSKAAKPAKAALPTAVDPQEAEAAADRQKVESMTLGSMLADPTLACGSVIATYGAPALAHWRPISGNNAADALEAMVHAVRGGDMSGLESMLVSQAVAMQSVFADCANRARAQTSREAAATLTGLAVKAQAASRATILAIVELKNPRSTIFAKQANVNNGGQQQVVNGAPVSHAHAREEMQTAQNELKEPIFLEHNSGSTAMDPGATLAASGSHQAARAVDSVHRAANRRREKHEREKF